MIKPRTSLTARQTVRSTTAMDLLIRDLIAVGWAAIDLPTIYFIHQADVNLIDMSTRDVGLSNVELTNVDLDTVCFIAVSCLSF